MKELAKKFLSLALPRPALTGPGMRFHLSDWPDGPVSPPDITSGTRVGVTSGGAPSDEDPGRFARTRGGGEAYHRSVLLEEVTHYLAPAPGKLYLDGTLGGGGPH